MAYDQLRSLYLTGKLHTTEDPYALGEEGMNRLENIYEFAKETAQAACDKASKSWTPKRNSMPPSRRKNSKIGSRRSTAES